MTSRLQRIVLVRHGETAGQSSIRYYGVTDVPLSDLGRRQLERVRRALQHEAFDVVYTSALRRTTEGARIIAPQVPACALPGFNEVNFGEWEGLTREEIATRDPDAYARWQDSLHAFAYPGGDTVPAFRTRVTTQWRSLLPTAPARVLVVAHKGVIRCILADLLGLDADDRGAWPIELASIHVVVTDGRRWQPAVVNALDHLEGLA